MREIKFRAWDDADGVHRDEGWMSYGITNIACDADHIMQYTGKKDKNGKEIYEGDIVKDLYGVLGPVVFVNGSFRLDSLNGHHLEESTTLLWQNKVDVTENDYGTYDLEVIGNIHENPELLGNDKEGR